MIISKKYINLFEENFNIENNNTEEVICILKEAGATQIDCVKVLMIKKKLSLREADSIVLNSKGWAKEKITTINFRNKFGKMITRLDDTTDDVEH